MFEVLAYSYKHGYSRIEPETLVQKATSEWHGGALAGADIVVRPIREPYKGPFKSLVLRFFPNAGRLTSFAVLYNKENHEAGKEEGHPERDRRTPMIYLGKPGQSIDIIPKHMTKNVEVGRPLRLTVRRIS